jgi:hypothetical protein
MTVWDWINEFESEAHERGDQQRLRLTSFHRLAWDCRHTDPARMLALLDEGRRLAVTLGESWWVLFFDHWRVETRIYYSDDYRGLIDLAAQVTFEVRKPGQEHHPLRFAIFCNLVAAYLCVDPRGYADAIRDALAYLTHELPADGEDRYLLIARRHWFAWEVGEIDEARRLALEELDLADSDPDRHTALHHEADTCKSLCRICHRQADWGALEEYARTGEARARQLDYKYELALVLLWQAVCARHDGREEEARRLCRQGIGRMGRLGKKPDDSYFDSLAAFHELGGELNTALAIRDRELAECLDRGQFAYEVECRLKRCRLLRRMGQLRPADIADCHTAIGRLRIPAYYLEELRQIESSAR